MNRKKLTTSGKEEVVLLTDFFDGSWRAGALVYWADGRTSRRPIGQSAPFSSEREATVKTLEYLLSFKSYFIDETVQDLEAALKNALQSSIFGD